MMRNDIDALLNDILASWHRWARGYQHVGGINSSPMFKNAKTSKGWDSVNDIVDSEIDSARMDAVEFCVNGDSRGQGAMPEPHKSAIAIIARNIASGTSVWRSPRLPSDPMELSVIVMEAKNMMLKRLLSAGVL